mgnify:CR=1 FL=1
MIEENERLPEATLLRAGPDGTEEVHLSGLTSGRRVVLFGVPGAFTPTCDSAHMPGFIQLAETMRQRGIDSIGCVSVNDAHVMRRWGEATGAHEAGIIMLADPLAAYTKALGLSYSNPAAGMYDRSRRYAMIVEDGVIEKLRLEEKGQCTISKGEDILDLI